MPGLPAEKIRTIIVGELERLNITSYELDGLLSIPAVETSQQVEIVQTLATVAETITDVKPRLEGSVPACDGWMFIINKWHTNCAAMASPVVGCMEQMSGWSWRAWVG